MGWWRINEIQAVCGLMVLSGFLFLTNLSNGMLWQDEAQTALIARTVLSGGIPRGTDGLNYFSQEEGAEYGKNYVWRWHTWFPFYLLAMFFALFGESTAIARLPFALFGLGCIFLTYRLCKRLTGRWQTGVVAGIILSVSVSFLLLARQCRYYSLCAFFVLWVLDSYVAMRREEQRASMYFVIASTLLFNCFYIYFWITLMTILFHASLWHRPLLRKVCVVSAISVVLNLPWMIWLLGMPYTRVYSLGLFDPPKALHFCGIFLKSIQRDFLRVYFLWVLALALMCRQWILCKCFPSLGGERASAWGLLGLMVIVNVLTVTAIAPFPHFRYLTPILPLMCICIVFLLERAWEWHYGLGIIALAAWVAAQPLQDFAYELTHPFVGPVEGFVGYLKEHAQLKDVVVISYEDLPLKFYTSLRVMGGITGEDLTPGREAEWVIIRKHSIGHRNEVLSQYMRKHFDLTNYRLITLPYPDTTFQNREDLADHYFRTVTKESDIVILQRIHR